MKVLVVGATGLTGGHLLNLLLERDSIEQVQVIGRNLYRLKDHPKLLKIEEPFENLKELSSEIDTAFCCLGTTIKKAKSKEAFKKIDYEFPLLVGKLLKKANPHIHYSVISALGADSNSPIFYNKVKGELEEDLKSLKLQSLHIFRPSLLEGKRKEQRFLEGLGQKVSPLLKAIMIGPLKNYRPIEAKTLAKVMIEKAFQYPKNYTFENLEILANGEAL